jgi:hypothetical protein
VNAEYPSGGSDAGVVALLERATRSLSEGDATSPAAVALRSNKDYVKLWITYVR